MTPRDDFLLLTSLPTSAASSLAVEQAAAPTAPPRQGAAAPLSCQRPFCEQQATSGALCERHAELMKDIRKEWEELSAEFEDGWT